MVVQRIRLRALAKSWNVSAINYHVADIKSHICLLCSVFETFVADVKTAFMARGAGTDPLIGSLESKVGDMRDEFNKITDSLENYDHKLISVLG